MKTVESYLSSVLTARSGQHLNRQLKVLPASFTDFSSNDFLGFAHHKSVDQVVKKSALSYNEPLSGSGGSRLITGNSAFAEELETELASFYKTESALLFNSGYDANLGLLSCIATRHDTLLYDELCHASIIDGIRLSQAGKKYKVRHNDLADLQKKLKQAQGNIFVVVESVYSMDGDLTPLTEWVQACKSANAALIVDEAHATGVMGEQGKGLTVHLQLEEEVFARVHTFGKALGCHGAVVVGSQTLRDYLINFARPFIYSTALPFHSLLNIKCAHQLLLNCEGERKKLQDLIAYFHQKTTHQKSAYTFLSGQSAIQSIIVGDNMKAKQLAEQFQQQQLDIRPILSPTVAKGTERLRICLHSFNTRAEIDQLFETFAHA